MTQALVSFAVFVVVAGAIVFTLTRRTRNKMRDALAEENAVVPMRPRNKREQVAMATTEADKPLPTIEELVAAEAADTGVNEIPGGDGLDVSLKLRVYWRDEVVRKGCSDGHIEFRIADDTTAEAAGTDDVRLVCVRDGVVQDAPDTADESGDRADS